MRKSIKIDLSLDRRFLCIYERKLEGAKVHVICKNMRNIQNISYPLYNLIDKTIFYSIYNFPKYIRICINIRVPFIMFLTKTISSWSTVWFFSINLLSFVPAKTIVPLYDVTRPLSNSYAVFSAPRLETDGHLCFAAEYLLMQRHTRPVNRFIGRAGATP